MKKVIIAVFISTHETMRAEKALKQAGVKIRTRLKPATISSNCQLALCFASGDVEKVLDIAGRESLALTGLYQEETDGRWKAIEG